MFIRKKTLAGMVAIVLLPLRLSAAEPEAAKSSTWDQIDPAWAEVSNKIIDFVGEEKQKLLADLAYAAVASNMCQSLKLDSKKFQAEFDDKLGKVDDKAISPADLTQYGEKVSMFFGVYVGMLTSIGMLERESFCNAAQETKSTGEGRYWAKK